MRNTGSPNWPLAHIILATCVKNGRDVVGILVSFRGFVVPCGMKHLVVIFKILCVTLSHVVLQSRDTKKKSALTGFRDKP